MNKLGRPKLSTAQKERNRIEREGMKEKGISPVKKGRAAKAPQTCCASEQKDAAISEPFDTPKRDLWLTQKVLEISVTLNQLQAKSDALNGAIGNIASGVNTALDNVCVRLSKLENELFPQPIISSIPAGGLTTAPVTGVQMPLSAGQEMPKPLAAVKPAKLASVSKVVPVPVKQEEIPTPAAEVLSQPASSYAEPSVNENDDLGLN